MTTVNTSTTAANDAQIRNHGAVSWASLLDGSAGTKSINTTIDDFANFAYADGTAADRYCDRCLFTFDLSAIPAGAIVTSARLRLYVSGKASGAGGSLGVTAATHATPPTTADWTNVSGTEYATRVNFSSFTTAAYNDLTFTSTGRSAIAAAAGGTLKLATRSSFDIDASGPGASVYSQVYGRLTDYTGTGSDPILEVTYDLPDVTVTAVPLAATVTSPTATVWTPIIVDSFTANEGAGTNLESHTPEYGSWSRIGASTSPVGRVKVSSAGRAYVDAASAGAVSAQYVHSDACVDGAIEADASVVSAAGYLAICYRRSSTLIGASGGNGYALIVDGGGWSSAGVLRLVKIVSTDTPNTTTLGTYSLPSWPTVGRVRLSCVGTKIKAIVNDAEVISVTDSALSSGFPGLLAGGSSCDSSVGVQFTSLSLSPLSSLVVTAVPLTATTTLPAPAVTTVSPSVTITAPPLAAAPRLSAPTLNGRLTITTGGGSSLTRSTNSAAVTAFASNGSPGTFGAHYAFPAAVQLPSGTRYLLVRKGSSHASSDGVPVSKISTDGVTWSSESTISPLTISGEDYRAGTVRLLSTGKLGCAFFTTRYNQFPSDIYKDAYRAYYSEGTLSGDTVTWRTPTRITGLSGLEDENNALEDFIELPNGELLFVTCGIDESPQAQFFNCFSFRGNAAGTSFGSVLTMALGTQVGRNAVEPSVTLLPDGRAFAQFHFEQSQDGSVPDAHAYQQYSTDSTITAWTTPTYVQVAWNRYGTLAHPDGDVIFAYGPTNSYQVFKQSTDSGATYGTAIDITGSPGVYYGNTWVTPLVIGSPGVSPNLAFAYGLEASGQTAGQVYYREFTRGASSASITATTEANLAASVTLPAPTISTAFGSGSATIAAVPLAVSVALSTPTSVGTGTGTDTAAAPLTAGVSLPTPIVVTTTGMPPASVSVTALPGTSSVALPVPAVVITGPGTLLVVHPQGMVPGTTIGAYRRWEWKGPVAAKLNAGPGSAVQETTVASDLTASFTLLPGEYVAYAPTYPTKRLFFMVTE